MEEDPNLVQTTHAHRISRQLKALADVNRIRILATLVAGECCVSELVRSLDIDQPKVSHHLAILRAAGVIRNRRDGRRINYSVRPSMYRRTEDGDAVVDEFVLDDVAIRFRFPPAGEEGVNGDAPRIEVRRARPAAHEEGHAAAAV